MRDSKFGYFFVIIVLKGGDKVNINDYIKKNEILSAFPYMTVYMTILELVKDGYILQNVD